MDGHGMAHVHSILKIRGVVFFGSGIRAMKLVVLLSLPHLVNQSRVPKIKINKRRSQKEPKYIYIQNIVCDILNSLCEWMKSRGESETVDWMKNEIKWMKDEG